MNDDLISRAAAIDAVKKNTFRLTFAEEQNCEGHVAWSANAVYSDVIEGELLELPSAQPETHEERTETHSCDCISRTQAIDILDAFEVKIENGEPFAYSWARMRITELHSAQPEIIYCRDCIHAIKDGLCGGYWCKGKAVKSSHFCGYAERRTDE